MYWTVSMQWWMHKYQVKLFCPEGWGWGEACWFLAYGSYIFPKLHEIYNRLIYNMAILGKPYFSPHGEPPRVILLQQDFSVDFEHMVLIFFWNYIKFAIDWYIIWLYLGTLVFHPMGTPPIGSYFLPRGAYPHLSFDCLPYFVWLYWCKKHLSQPNFMLLSQFARLLC